MHKLFHIKLFLKTSFFNEVFYFITVSLFIISCNDSSTNYSKRTPKFQVTEKISSPPPFHLDSIPKLEKKFIEFGLTNVNGIDSTIKSNLRYSEKTNVLGRDLYGGLNKIYLAPFAAKKLVKAQLFLKKENNSYSLLVWDAARPVKTQQILWDSLHKKMGVNQQYLTHPSKYSLHNYGAAVDITIADSSGNLLDMGTDFDHFGDLAEPQQEYKLLVERKLTIQQVENRKLLRKIMQHAGFIGIPSEWWHFNAGTKDFASKHCKLVE